MSDDIVVISPRSIAESKELSKDLALSTLLPLALRKNPNDVLVVMLTGAELGLAPMQAVRGIHIIEGKASLSAGLLMALVKRSPVCEYMLLIESTDKVATYETKRRGDPAPTRMSFTIEQARAAQLLSKANFQKYPAAMLRARCEAAISRAVYSDVCFNLYDGESEELDVTPSTFSAPADAVPTSQAAHVEAVKSELRKSVTAPKPEAIEDAVIVEPGQTSLTEALASIAVASTLDQLKALTPIFKSTVAEADREAVRVAFLARRDALYALSVTA